MTGLWTAFVLFCQLTVLQREPWIGPVPGVSLEPTRPVRQETDFGPDSAYRLLGKAASSWETAECDPMETSDLLGSQPWTDEQYAMVRQHLQAAEPSLVLARKAAVAADPQVPTTAIAQEELRDWHNQLRFTLDLLTLSAYAKEREGHPEQAIDELFAALRCGQVAACGGSMLGRHTGESRMPVICEGIWRIASRNRLQPPVLRHKAQELLQISEATEPLAETFRYEIMTMDREVSRPDLLQHVGVPSAIAQSVALARLLTGSSQTAVQRDLHFFFQHCVQLSAPPYSRNLDAWLVASHKMPEDTAGLARLALVTKDPAGQVLVWMTIPVYRQMVAYTATCHALLRGTALSLAIRSYELEQHAPPPLLADLVPDFLPQLPPDPFTGESFRYIVQGIPQHWGNVSWGIYSVGSDFTDNGGTETNPLGRFRMGGAGKTGDIVWLAPEVPRR